MAAPALTRFKQFVETIKGGLITPAITLRILNGWAKAVNQPPGLSDEQNARAFIEEHRRQLREFVLGAEGKTAGDAARTAAEATANSQVDITEAP